MYEPVKFNQNPSDSQRLDIPGTKYQGVVVYLKIPRH